MQEGKDCKGSDINVGDLLVIARYTIFLVRVKKVSKSGNFICEEIEGRSRLILRKDLTYQARKVDELLTTINDLKYEGKI